MNFYETLTAAVNDLIEHGFDNENRVRDWMDKIYLAAMKEMIPDEVILQKLEQTMKAQYHRLVTKGGVLNKHISKYTLERIKPKLRAELDRRIITSSNLIKLNRETAINTILRRFEGWATSIPAGGTKTTDRVKEKQNIRKSLGKLSFEERRVIIDQTHKLVSNINEIVAVDSGAIAAEWHSHWRQPNYDYRKDHKERDDKIYVIKEGWAYQEGLIKAKNGFVTDITRPGEEVYCRCNYVYLYDLSQVKELLTRKGEKELLSRKS